MSDPILLEVKNLVGHVRYFQRFLIHLGQHAVDHIHRQRHLGQELGGPGCLFSELGVDARQHRVLGVIHHFGIGTVCDGVCYGVVLL